jgi:hypothetical protein
MDLLNQMGQSHTDDNFGIDNPLNILVDSVGQNSLDITSTWPSASPFVEEKTTSIWSSAFSFDVEEEKTQTEEVRKSFKFLEKKLFSCPYFKMPNFFCKV